jgi:3-oxoacyl-[acyl-carrier protein] reductase
MDIAAAVCFLASPLADFMTGTTFRIDGGSTPTL